jgi:hypothetical protein
MKKLAILFLIPACSPAFGQKDIAKFFPAAAAPGNVNNVQQLVSGYISPIAEDFGSLMNNGWYNTAATHKKFGFDFSVTMNTIAAKSDAKFFTVPSLTGVSYNGTLPSTATDKAPTAYGPKGKVPSFAYTSGANNGIPFFGPDGGNITEDVPIGSMVVPTMQLGVGLFGNTDLRIRYTPAITISDTELSNWGVGVHHDIKQHIPGIKELPFSLSLFLAYSSLKASTNLSGRYTGTGQEGLGETTGFTGQVLISKSLAVVTFYGGIGFNSSSTTYSIKGSYVVDRTDAGFLLPSPVNLTNPYKQDFKVSGFRATGGMRLKLGPIIMNGDYSLVNAKGLFTAGFGFTVR